jgi:hypothetical protein
LLRNEEREREEKRRMNTTHRDIDIQEQEA